MFRVGDRIAHPMHGAGVVEGIEERHREGRGEQYYALRLLTGGLRILVPVDSAGKLGLRPVLKSESIRAVLEAMPNLEARMDSNWNRRYRENMDRIRTGDLTELCRVIKGLTLRERETGLSTGERKMLWSAKQIMISEIRMADKSDYAQAEATLAAALGACRTE